MSSVTASTERKCEAEGVILGVGIVKSVNVRQDYKKIGVGQQSYIGGQSVIVAESSVA